MITEALIAETGRLKREGLHRKRMLASHSQHGQVINFSSSDYLSLSNEPYVKKGFQKGFTIHPTGSSGSMVVCGYHPIHRELEQAFATTLQTDDALLFSSGYAANIAVISLLTRFDADLFIDKAAHASIYDGLRLAQATYSRFLHNNLQDLALKLKAPCQNPVVLAESVFSMSGQTTDLGEMIALCKRYNAECLVDEAHAFGVLGPEGMGAVMQYGLSQEDVPLRVIPLGKAFAAQGAVVVGKKEWIDALLQTARSYVYSTALSPAFAYGLLQTLTFVKEAEGRRNKLRRLIAYFQQQTISSPLTWRYSHTPIQQLQFGCPHKALKFASLLLNKGIFCQAMRAPTVSKKDTGLRVILNYHHEPELIAHLFSLLHQNYESIY